MKWFIAFALVILDYILVITNLLGVTNVSWWVLTLPITLPWTAVIIFIVITVLGGVLHAISTHANTNWIER